MLMPCWVKLLPVALLIAGCATNESREIILVDSYTSKEMKTLQSSPYEIQTWAWLSGISRADIHAIEALVARHQEIRKPILRMMAVKTDRVQVLTGAMNIAATFTIPFMSLNAMENGVSKNPKSRTFVLQWIARSFFDVVAPASNQSMKPTAPLRN